MRIRESEHDSLGTLRTSPRLAGHQPRLSRLDSLAKKPANTFCARDVGALAEVQRLVPVFCNVTDARRVLILRAKCEARTVGAVKHAYEVRPRKDHRGVDLISDALPFCRLKTSSFKQSRAFFCLHEILNSV